MGRLGQPWRNGNPKLKRTRPSCPALSSCAWPPCSRAICCTRCSPSPAPGDCAALRPRKYFLEHARLFVRRDGVTRIAHRDAQHIVCVNDIEFDQATGRGTTVCIGQQVAQRNAQQPRVAHQGCGSFRMRSAIRPSGQSAARSSNSCISSSRSYRCGRKCACSVSMRHSPVARSLSMPLSQRQNSRAVCTCSVWGLT